MIYVENEITYLQVELSKWKTWHSDLKGKYKKLSEKHKDMLFDYKKLKIQNELLIGALKDRQNYWIDHEKTN